MRLYKWMVLIALAPCVYAWAAPVDNRPGWVDREFYGGHMKEVVAQTNKFIDKTAVIYKQAHELSKRFPHPDELSDADLSMCVDATRPYRAKAQALRAQWNQESDRLMPSVRFDLGNAINDTFACLYCSDDARKDYCRAVPAELKSARSDVEKEVRENAAAFPTANLQHW